MLQRAVSKSSRPRSTYSRVSSASRKHREKRGVFGSHLPGVFRSRPHGTRVLLHPDSNRSEAGEPRIAPRMLHLRVGRCGASALTGPAAPHPRPLGPPALSPTRIVICRPRPGRRAPRSQPARTSSATSRAHLPGARPRAPDPAAQSAASSRGRARRAPAPACRGPSLLLPSGLTETPAHCSTEPAQVRDPTTPTPSRGPTHQSRESQYRCPPPEAPPILRTGANPASPVRPVVCPAAAKTYGW